MLAANPAVELLHQAQAEPVLLLARVEPHWAGGATGLAGAALGVFVANTDWSFKGALAWVALAAIVLGMVLHWRWRRADSGWRVHFAERRVEPFGQPGQPESIEGDGWEIQTAPGDGRHRIAIDLRHRDRGRVARLYDVVARRQSQIQTISALADRLAERLAVERTGPRL
ncbi:MAG: hypothetical protein ACOVOT_08875 [Rubrivivax sp.]|jgi:hypothetical protein|nr:hypothetical protein [Rubrivivax sp.]